MSNVKAEQIIELLRKNKFVPKKLKYDLNKNVKKFSKEQLMKIFSIFEQKEKIEAEINLSTKNKKDVVAQSYVKKIMKIKDEKLPAFLEIYETAKRNIEKRGADDLLNDI